MGFGVVLVAWPWPTQGEIRIPIRRRDGEAVVPIAQAPHSGYTDARGKGQDVDVSFDFVGPGCTHLHVGRIVAGTRSRGRGGLG